MDDALSQFRAAPQPLAEEPQPAPPPKPELRDIGGRDIGGEPDRMMARLRAMVVEDEIFVAWHIEAMLQEIGVEVATVASRGQEAIEKAREIMPDLVIMDVNLQNGIDGIEAGRRIRELCDAHIVFVTAYGDAKTLARIAQTLPGAPVLAKPTSVAKLGEAIGLPHETQH
jgi:CheY-like chemotaxis protein